MNSDHISKFHDLKLHESMSFNNIFVVRVVGGWIYKLKTKNPDNSYTNSVVFVPHGIWE